MRTIQIAPRSMYYGTPVALITTCNDGGSENIAAMSSSWSLRNRIVLGMGAASQTVANLKRVPELSINLPDASMWTQVEKLSALTGRRDAPAHKTTQFSFEPDKWKATGFTRAASVHIGPGRISECPLQMEAVVESMTFVDDEPEGFSIVVARVEAMYAHDSVLTAELLCVDPDRWKPLIFSYRSYRTADVEVGRMSRGVRR